MVESPSDASHPSSSQLWPPMSCPPYCIRTARCSQKCFVHVTLSVGTYSGTSVVAAGQQVQTLVEMLGCKGRTPTAIARREYSINRRSPRPVAVPSKWHKGQSRPRALHTLPCRLGATGGAQLATQQHKARASILNRGWQQVLQQSLDMSTRLEIKLMCIGPG